MNTKIKTTKQPSNDVLSFRRVVYGIYSKNKRDTLPWRKTIDPYKIFVSEIMLQQTQVDRVIPKYTAWIQKFPDIKSVSQATQSEILSYWQGLGYNRRALFLKRACESIVQIHNGVFPNDYSVLLKLPGIGQSTAGAILNFAFNTPTSFIETNIRTIYLHHFFKNKTHVSDTDIYAEVQRTLDTKNPREWFYALYDYGTLLKKELGVKKTLLHKQSKHYHIQSKFKGSDRQIRGEILKYALQRQSSTRKGACSITEFRSQFPAPKGVSLARIKSCIIKMQKEGILSYSENTGTFAIL